VRGAVGNKATLPDRTGGEANPEAEEDGLTGPQISALLRASKPDTDMAGAGNAAQPLLMF